VSALPDTAKQEAVKTCLFSAMAAPLLAGMSIRTDAGITRPGADLRELRKGRHRRNVGTRLRFAFNGFRM